MEMINTPHLTDRERRALFSLIAERGEVQAAAALPVARTTLLRALAKRPLRLGSLLVIRQGLAALEQHHTSTNHPPQAA